MKVDHNADYVFRNGKIITVNTTNDVCEAIAIKGDKIIALGMDSDVGAYICQSTKVIDLKGRSLLPGFNEAHMHYTMYSMLVDSLMVSVEDAKSIQDIKNKVKKEVAKKQPGEWIYMGGYDQNKLADKRHIHHSDLDEVSPNNPVCVKRVCYHMAVFNKRAMELANITDRTQFDNPSEVDRDSNGKLTGLFKEGAQTELLASFKFTREECKKSFKAGEKLLHSYGVTSVQDVGEGMDNFGKNVLQDEIMKRKIKLRIYMSWCGLTSRAMGLKIANHMIEMGPHSGIGNEWYKMGPIKVLLDGSTSGPSALMKEPFDHDRNLKGIQNYPNQDELNALFLRGTEQGFQITAHAVGDLAVEQALEAYEYVNESYPIMGRRFRIEHAGFTSEKNAKRAKKLGLVIVSNPSFFAINGRDYNKYYDKRVEDMFPSARYRRLGVIEAYGTDCPVTPPNPILSIHGAVTRKDIKNDVVCGESQKVDVMYAIRCLTYNAAYASFEEDIKGSLEVGKLADLIILSDDILKSEMDEIQNIIVDCTMIGGEIVYNREGTDSKASA